MRKRLMMSAMLLAIAGCAAAPQATRRGALPVDVLGTWLDPAQRGFVSIGQQQVVVAVDGQRALLPIVENRIEAGMTAGQLVLGDGTTLYLARSVALVNGQYLPALDVDFAGAVQLRRQLVSETVWRWAGVAPPAAPLARSEPPPASSPPLAATGATGPAAPLAAGSEASPAARAPTAASAAPPQPPAPAVRPDPGDAFLQALPSAWRASGERLLEQARRGASGGELWKAYINERRAHFAAACEALERAQREPERRREHLGEAERRLREADEFAAAWRQWLERRGG